MKLHKNIDIRLADGKIVRADVEEYTRGGTMSPSNFFIIYEGKRYSPYAQKIKNINLTLSFLFKRIYGEVIKYLIPETPNFWKSIKCDKTYTLYHQPVILGIEHGVIFKEDQ